MDPILDFDIADNSNNRVYHWWVDNAPAITEAVVRWHVRAHGHPPHEHAMFHALWRVVEERQRWRTLRNGLQDTWPIHDPVVPIVNGHVSPSPPILITRGPIHPRLYAGWSNAWVNPRNGATYIFAAMRYQRPTFWRLDPDGRTVNEIGPLVRFDGETEGWYWNAKGLLYIPLGGSLLRVNPFTTEEEVVFEVGSRWPGHAIIQPHSSVDDNTHVAVLLDSNWNKVGVVIAKHGDVWRVDVERKPLDEVEVDAIGEWALIKEGAGPDNRIVDLRTRESRWLNDAEGAVAHCGMGDGFVVGEADKPDPGRMVKINLRTLERHDLVYTYNMGHVSVVGERALWSDPLRRQLVLINLKTDESRILTELLPSWDPGIYDRQVRANLSPCGTRVCYETGGALYVITL